MIIMSGLDRTREEMLREIRLSAIIDSSPIPMFVIGRDHRIIHWNKALEKYSGLKAAGMAGTDQQWRAFYPKKRPCLADFLVDGKEDEIPSWYRGKYRPSKLIEGAYEAIDFFPALRESGAWMHFTAAVIKDSGGAVTGAVETLEDITERRQTEEELRQSEESFRVLAETSPAAILLYKGEHFEYVNPTAEKLTEYSEKELLAMNFWDVVDPDYREIVKERGLARQRGEPVPQQYEFRYVTRSGVKRWALLSAGTLNYKGKPACLATIIDITERKFAEEALVEAKNRAELYVDLMSHDLSNINHMIMGFLEMAINTVDPKGEAKEFLTKPVELTQRSSHLIDTVKNIQKIKTGAVPLKLMDAGEVLAGVVRQYSEAPDRQVKIDFVPATGCLVMGNVYLGDVYSNLIENAIEHCSKPLEMHIGISEMLLDSWRYYKITFEDNGPGISDEQKGYILADMSKEKVDVRRIGFSLQLVKAVVESIHGRILVEDRKPGDFRRGCRFILLLPAAGQ